MALALQACGPWTHGQSPSVFTSSASHVTGLPGLVSDEPCLLGRLLCVGPSPEASPGPWPSFDEHDAVELVLCVSTGGYVMSYCLCAGPHGLSDPGEARR